MKEVVITADSTCDLPKSIIEKNNIVITPLSILLGEDTFLDGVDVFPANVFVPVLATNSYTFQKLRRLLRVLILIYLIS